MEEINKVKEYIKDISYLILAFLSGISLYNNELVSYKSMFYGLNIYTMADLIFFKLTNDVYIHHGLVMMVFLLDYMYYDKIDIKISNIFSKICLYFEISSIFLAIISICKKLESSFIKRYKVLDIMNVLFYGFFIYFRLYYFSNIFIFNNDLHLEVFDFCNVQNVVHSGICKIQFYGTFLSFFLLNIYWFHIMTKIMVKNSGLKKIISKKSASYYENILGYTLYVKPILLTLVYIYHKLNDIEHYMDIIVVSILSVASMYCHHMWRNIFEKKELKEDDVKLIQKYTLYDQVAIHIRSVIIMYGIFQDSKEFYMSLVLHFLTTKQIYDDLYNKNINKNMEVDKMIEYINNSVYFNLGATFFYDNIMVSFYNFFDFHCQNNLILGMFIAASFFIRPFYEANQIYVHFLIILQTLILGVLNVKY